jgi:hypothetical protein
MKSRVSAVHDLRLVLVLEVALAAEQNVQHPAVVGQLHEKETNIHLTYFHHFQDLVVRHCKAALAVKNPSKSANNGLRSIPFSPK